MSSAWFTKCFHCAHYSGAQTSGGVCRMWGSVVALESPLAQQCPHWSCRDAFRGKSGGERAAEGARRFDRWHEQGEEISALSP